ncbi:hypothetical protein EAH89_10440 [Roseomonas nepalensis]|uniref:Uncharacterized protein n=1 Tax=Muricoccus nepalensis TaxID=1854500 RepID=A0A502G9X5_9PROT|nr:hypothetical protein EAH89_10440 [Roseomonas nepalensis]
MTWRKRPWSAGAAWTCRCMSSAGLRRVEARLREPRFVTLVGAVGVGKTRLVLAAADRIWSPCRDGAWFADLGPLEEPRLIPAVIVSAQEPLEQRPRMASSVL